MTQGAILPDWMAERLSAPDPTAIDVPVADADVVALFFALDTQWRVHPMTGERVGLDFTAVRPTAELGGYEVGPSLLADLKAMEGAALDCWAERAR